MSCLCVDVVGQGVTARSHVSHNSEKRWRLYILPQYLANDCEPKNVSYRVPRTFCGSLIFAIFSKSRLVGITTFSFFFY